MSTREGWAGEGVFFSAACESSTPAVCFVHVCTLAGLLFFAARRARSLEGCAICEINRAIFRENLYVEPRARLTRGSRALHRSRAMIHVDRDSAIYMIFPERCRGAGCVYCLFFGARGRQLLLCFSRYHASATGVACGRGRVT